ncbi:MAG: hypothetical protein SFY69_13640 [Planctomycetota bacterium]|nr:hypothetical protein [Planctomycetota bacterium]
MHEPGHANPPSVTPAVGIDAQGPPPPSKITGPWRVIALCAASLAVMAPWPLLGILATQSLFDRSSEAFMLFGGITLFPLLILAIFGVTSEDVLITLMMLVWAAAVVVPDLWLRRRLRSWAAVSVLLVVQSGFSFAQAAMGAMLILGKSV